MSDVTPLHDEDGPHEGPIKTPKQLVVAVVFAFVVPIIAIILLVAFVSHEKKPAAGSDLMSAQPTAERIRPVGIVEVKDLSDPSALKNGEQVYGAVCVACHATGALNAPKFADAAAWGPRLSQGFDTLLTHALKGKGAMPPQGGGDYTDLEIGRAVVYMANKAGAKFEEPKATAQAVAGAASGASAPTPAPATPTTAQPTTSAAVSTTAPAAAVTAAAAVRPDLPGLPRGRRRGCPEDRRQGGLGATARPRRRRPDRQRDQGQGCDAAEGRLERQRRRHQGRRQLHGEPGQVSPAQRAASGFSR